MKFIFPWKIHVNIVVAVLQALSKVRTAQEHHTNWIRPQLLDLRDVVLLSEDW